MPQDPLHLASISKRPFAYFLLCAGLFVATVTAALLYGVSRPQTPVIEEQERLAVDQCWRSSQDSTQSRPSRRFQEDACREMEAQFRSKFRHGR